ncbi:nuclease domain-containing protein [Arthrobacter oryzae]|uniref:nuclease domain-containing protein n=1 Tax=Arthrobacter oryzae TaxID=409290 RepID=UPI0030C95A2E
MSSGISGVDGDFTHVPLRETFRLYETWVSLRLARAAGLLDPGLDAAAMFADAEDPNRLTVSLRSTSVQFNGHVLKFKHVFNEVWLSPDGVGSYSRQMIPDVVLEVLASDTGSRRMVVLDAKYRVEAQLNDAISSIHMYKDSLIHEDRAQGGTEDRHVVGSGLVVVPSLPGRMTVERDWRSEKMPIVVFREGYQKRFKLGAMLLSPGTDISSIAATLQGLIQSNGGLIP